MHWLSNNDRRLTLTLPKSVSIQKRNWPYKYLHEIHLFLVLCAWASLQLCAILSLAVELCKCKFVRRSIFLYIMKPLTTHRHKEGTVIAHLDKEKRNKLQTRILKRDLTALSFDPRNMPSKLSMHNVVHVYG